MANIHSIRLKNLRCLQDTGYVEIKPITILVGKNSAGKSTFARSLPLLRQSAEEEKRAPILWYGRLVDFGDFKTALNRTAEQKEISFSFKISLPETRRRHFYPDDGVQFYHDDWGLRLGQASELVITFNLSLDSTTNTTYASSIEITLFGNNCKLNFSDSKNLKNLIVNGYTWDLSDAFTTIITQKNITPEIRFLRQITRKINGEDRKTFVSASPFTAEILKTVSNLAHANTNPERMIRLARNIFLDTDERMLDKLKNSLHAPYSFKSNVSRMDITSEKFLKLKNLVFASSLPQLLDLIDLELSIFFQGVRYIEPLRATAQRYYRRQELAVDEIDSKGANVAMYFDSLTSTERDKLNKWLSKYFGFELIPRNDGGHIALSSKSKDSNEVTNLADLGVGISQIIPIVLQLWQAANPNIRKNKNSRLSNHSCVVIEQPELHLHPAYQAKIADVFLASIDDAKSNGKQISIIAETHSPHLINRLGELVANGAIDKNDVQIIFFEDSEKIDSSSVRISQFDRDGILTNWPFGFFEPI